MNHLGLGLHLLLLTLYCPYFVAAQLTQVSSSGGRVDWYKGENSHHLIAFDAIVNDTNKNTELFTMEPDGSSIQPLTGINDAVPEGFIGQPAWHPDGEHLVFQVENGNSQHIRFNHLSWGINNDLWIMRRDGTGAQCIWTTPLNHGALHPHFSEDGTQLVFSERIATNEILYSPLLTPGGENPWAGWQIHLAQVDLNEIGTAILSNHQVLFGEGLPKDRGLYEAHGFYQNRLWYSYTADGHNYVDDCYSCLLDGTDIINHIQSVTTWEEHGVYAPGGDIYSFISSRINLSWDYPEDNASNLTTELYFKEGETIYQVTDFNATGDPAKRYLVSDYDWNKSGTEIAFQVAPVDKITGAADAPQIWVMTLPTPIPTPSITPTATMTSSATQEPSLVYPNPAQDIVYFRVDCGDQPRLIKVTILNLLGEQIGQITKHGGPGLEIINWQTNKTAPGIYIAQIIIEGQEMISHKFAIIK